MPVCLWCVLFTVHVVVTRSVFLVLSAIHEGCIQLWSGNGKCIFRNKIEKFCCNLNLY